MGKADAPTPAQPQQVAGEQTKSNVGTAVANATLGNVNQYSPYGSTTYQETGGKWIDGNWVPSYSQTTALSEPLQNILTGTQNTAQSLLPAGQTLADQYKSNLTAGPYADILKQGPQALDQSTAQTIYNGQMSLLQPTFDQQNRQLENQLSRQGIPLGSEAYGNAQTQLGTQQNQARTAALGTATQQGNQAATQMFNLALLGQKAPLDQLTQLYGGAVG